MSTLTQELEQIEKASVSQDVKEFMKDQALIKESQSLLTQSLAINKSLKEEIERLKKIIKENSDKCLEVVSNNALLLNEIEARFDRELKFDSEEIFNDYMKAAKYAETHCGRKNNRIAQAQEWFDKYSLNF